MRDDKGPLAWNEGKDREKPLAILLGVKEDGRKVSIHIAVQREDRRGERSLGLPEFELMADLRQDQSPAPEQPKEERFKSEIDLGELDDVRLLPAQVRRELE